MGRLIALVGGAALIAGCAAAGASPDGAAPDWWGKARAAEERQDWSSAGRYLDMAIQGIEPDEAWLERRVRVADRGGDESAGLRFRRALLDRRPWDLELRLGLAEDLSAAGRTAEAESLLRERPLRDRGGFESHRALARLLESEGRRLEAAVVLESLAAGAPAGERGLLWQDAARLYEAEGRLEEALHAMEEGLRGAPVPEHERSTLSRTQALLSGRPQEVGDAVELLHHHPDPSFRLAGARFLAERSFEDEVPVFAASLGDPEEEIVRIALAELGKRGGAAAAPSIAPLLHHSSPGVRREAATGLARCGDRSFAPYLIDALDPEDRAAFRAVRRALEDLTDHAIGASFDPDLEERREIAAQWRVWWVQGAGEAPRS